MLQRVPHTDEEMRTGPYQYRETQNAEKRPHDSARAASHWHPLAQPWNEIRITQRHNGNRYGAGKPELPHQVAVFLLIRSFGGVERFTRRINLGLGNAIAGRCNGLTDSVKIDRFRIVFDIYGIGPEAGARRKT